MKVSACFSPEAWINLLQRDFKLCQDSNAERGETCCLIELLQAEILFCHLSRLWFSMHVLVGQKKKRKRKVFSTNNKDKKKVDCSSLAYDTWNSRNFKKKEKNFFHVQFHSPPTQSDFYSRSNFGKRMQQKASLGRMKKVF